MEFETKLEIRMYQKINYNQIRTQKKYLTLSSQHSVTILKIMFVTITQKFKRNEKLL